MSRSIVTDTTVQDDNQNNTDVVGTTLTFKDRYGTYSISLNEDELTLIEVMDRLVVPVLTSAGFSAESFDKMLEGLYKW